MKTQWGSLDPCMGLGRGRCRMLVELLVGAALLFGFYTELNHYRIYTELRDSGIVAVGHVTAQHFSERGCNENMCSEDSYTVSYMFEVNGQQFTGGSKPDDRFRTLKEGDPVNILYVAGDPATHLIADENTFSLPESVVLVMSYPLFATMCGFPIFWFVFYLLLLPMIRFTTRLARDSAI